MNIIVINGKEIEKSSSIWSKIENFGNVKYYDGIDLNDQKNIVKLIGDSEIVLSSKIKYPRTVLEKLPNLKYIGILATGYNIVDYEYSNKNGITVTNIPSYSSPMVAQHAIMLLLAVAHNTKFYTEFVKDGYWFECRKYHRSTKPLIELENKILGIIGYGEIGKSTAIKAKGLGMNILIYDVEQKYKDGIFDEQVSFDELIYNSDVVSIHCPSTKYTENMINKNVLSKMKKRSILINTARGEIVNEQDLYEALKNNLIFGAGLDTVKNEPIKVDNPLLTLDNCIITPHIGCASNEAMERLFEIAYQNLKAYINGCPINVVNQQYY